MCCHISAIAWGFSKGSVLTRQGVAPLADSCWIDAYEMSLQAYGIGGGANGFCGSCEML
jgi:hypothetical protein